MIQLENDVARRVMATLVVIAALASCAGDAPQARMLAAAAQAPSYRVVIPVPPPAPAYVAPPRALASTIAALGADFDGRIGIAVRSVDDGWSVQSNGATRMPQQSVSKLWVAMTVLDHRDRGLLNLEDPISVTREDLTLFHQPIASLIKGGSYDTTIGELLRRAMTMSDNTANDRLLRIVGGPPGVRDFIARKQLGEIRFGPGERLLQSATAGLAWRSEFSLGNAFAQARAQLPKSTRINAFERYVADPPDGAAPSAIAGALARLKRGELLSRRSTEYLIDVMESSKTGKQRLRGAVPPGWSFGHKTGTGQDLAGRTAGYNDVGLLEAPDGRTYALAVMIGDTRQPIPERQQVMQAVVAAVVAEHG